MIFLLILVAILKNGTFPTEKFVLGNFQILSGSKGLRKHVLKYFLRKVPHLAYSTDS